MISLRLNWIIGLFPEKSADLPLSRIWYLLALIVFS